jgi:phage-related protein
MITFRGSVNNLLSSTKSAANGIAKLGAGVVNIGKALASALGGNFRPLIGTVVGAITSFAKVLLLIPGFLIALVNPVNVAGMAMANFSTAISAASPQAFLAAIRNMAPAMKDAVMAVRLLHPQLKNLYGIIQQGFWLGFTEDINNLARVYFPILGTGLGGIATTLGKLRHELFDFFLRPEIQEAIKGWMAAFNGLFASLVPMVGTMLPTMITLFTSFANILTNLLPLITVIAGWLVRILEFITPILSGLSGIVGGAASGAGGGSSGGGGGGGFFSSIFHGITSFFSGLFGRAGGGSVLGGQSYLVGERGPEILRMGGASSGAITPNGGGATYITVKIGETELRGIVSSEVQQLLQDVALSTRMGRGVIN